MLKNVLFRHSKEKDRTEKKSMYTLMEEEDCYGNRYVTLDANWYCA